MDLRPTVFVVLLFPRRPPDSRWVHEVPRIGAQIHDSRGHPWRVAEVLRSGIDVYTVTCQAPAHGLGAVSELATDLLDRTRKAISSTERKRKRSYP